MNDTKIIYVKFPEEFNKVECIKIENTIFINSIYQESSLTSLLVPLTGLE